MVSKVSFQSANTQKNLWSAFQNNHGQTSKTVPNNPASAIQKNANDKVSSNENNSKNYSSYIWGGIIGAAIIGLGIWYYSKHGKKPIKTQEIPSPNPNTGFSFKDIITSFISKVSKEGKGRYESALSQQKLRRADCFKLLKNEEGILSLEQFFAVQNAKIKNELALPNIIEMPNLNPENTSNVGKVFYKQFEAGFEKRRYISGDTKEFLAALQDFTAQKSDNYTFMHIENFNEFLSDLNKPKNVSLLEKFKTLLLQNEQKKLSYLTEKVDDYANIPIKKLSLDFSDKANACNFFMDTLPFNNFKSKHNIEMAEKIVQNLNDRMFLDKQTAINLLNTTKPHIVLHNANSETAETFVSRYISETGGKSTILDCRNKSLSDITSELSKLLQECEKYNGRTDKVSLVYLKNIEQIINNSCDINSAEYKTLQELLQTANEKYKAVFISSVNDNSGKFLNSIQNDDFSFFIKCKNLGYDKKLFSELNSEVKTRMEKSECPKEIADKLYYKVINSILFEKAGLNISLDELLPEYLHGGIMLFSKTAKDNNIAQQALEHALGNLIKKEKMSFDKNDLVSSFKKIINKVKSLEEEYARTKTRTILEVENLEDLLLLAPDGNTIRVQSAFKNFIESCPKKYHTNILFKTTKKLSEFEPSCIPPHRFEVIYTGLE